MTEAISPLNLNSQTMPIMAAKNKSLAENNKSRIGGKATKNRSFQRSLPQEPPPRHRCPHANASTLELRWSGSEIGILAAKNKCLAESNKSSDVAKRLRSEVVAWWPRLAARLLGRQST